MASALPPWSRPCSRFWSLLSSLSRPPSLPPTPHGPVSCPSALPLVGDAQQPPAARRVAPALTGEVVDAGLVQPPGAGLHPPHVLLELGHRAQAAHHPLTARIVRAAVRAAGEVGVL